MKWLCDETEIQLPEVSRLGQTWGWDTTQDVYDLLLPGRTVVTSVRHQLEYPQPYPFPPPSPLVRLHYRVRPETLHISPGPEPLPPQPLPLFSRLTPVTSPSNFPVFEVSSVQADYLRGTQTRFQLLMVLTSGSRQTPRLRGCSWYHCFRMFVHEVTVRSKSLQ